MKPLIIPNGVGGLETPILRQLKSPSINLLMQRSTVRQEPHINVIHFAQVRILQSEKSMLIPKLHHAMLEVRETLQVL